MSIISKEALLEQQAINAKCVAKQTGSSYYKEKAKAAQLELENHQLKKEYSDANARRNYNKGYSW